jgi:hypothetical protein
VTVASTRGSPSSSALLMSSRGDDTNADFMRWARQSRSAGAEDNVVELLRPLGLVLNEDKRTGNVFVETVAPGGNAARTGKVRGRGIDALASHRHVESVRECCSLRTFLRAPSKRWPLSCSEIARSRVCSTSDKFVAC